MTPEEFTQICDEYISQMEKESAAEEEYNKAVDVASQKLKLARIDAWKAKLAYQQATKFTAGY